MTIKLGRLERELWYRDGSESQAIVHVITIPSDYATQLRLGQSSC
jgi:hypothetical protein